MKVTPSIAILNSKAPLTASHAKDALELALIYGAYEQAPALFFQYDGVFQLSNALNLATVKSKEISKTFGALSFYDVEDIYVCETSLALRKIELPLNIPNAKIINRADFITALHRYQKIIRF